jgi:hypothetical protein
VKSVVLALLAWLAANALILCLAGPELPINLPDPATGKQLTGVNTLIAETLLMLVLIGLLTRRRPRPDLAARAPEHAGRETLGLLAYGAVAMAVGYALGKTLGWHPFGWHLAGSVFGTHDDVTPREAVTWAGYNLVAYAIIPFAYFRRRYSARELNLRSADRRADTTLILAVLTVESLVQIVALEPAIFDLSARQLALGAPLTFVLYFAGTVLPAMVFVFAILLPRLARLTGSTAATVMLGGLAYTVFHLWDAWAVFGSPREVTVSLCFLLLTYTGPGMVKSWLTVRTGNAWVHVWAYHALAPHTLNDTSLIVRAFRIR